MKKYFCTLLFLLTLSCTQNNKGKCYKCGGEIHSEFEYENEELGKFQRLEKDLFEKFEIESVKSNSTDAYQFIFYSSMGYGKSITFNKNDPNYMLRVKCIVIEEANGDCENYTYQISKSEWEFLEKIIYEFDFWTEPKIRYNTNVLDGFGYYIEGQRELDVENEMKSYRSVFRGTPFYDKIGAMFEKIVDYEDSLRFRLKQRE